MNIFVLDMDPIQAARWQCDRHVIKMPTECAQMLNTTSILLGGSSYKKEYPPYDYYKVSHPNNLVTKWVRESLANFEWLVIHGLALCEEYTKRYKKDIKSRLAIEWVLNYGKKPIGNSLTRFHVGVKSQYKKESVVDSYRWAYCFDKARFAKWEKGVDPPPWFRKFEPPIEY